jgi:HAD superfamily hydrolase (TIGR01484 family)
MKPLPSLDQPRHLLSFDFDGTLHDPAATPSVPPKLFGLLESLRETHHASWGVNTGRNIEFLLEGLEDSGFPFLPDWVVAREREVHVCNADGEWRAHHEWNARCAHDIATLFESQKQLLERIRHDVDHQTGAQWLSMEGEPAGVIAQSEEEIDWIVSRVLEHIDGDSDLSWQRNSIYLRFGHRGYHKGSSLAEVARLMSVDAANCFAIGDSHNDSEMLDGAHAGMLACPANAIHEIRELVSNSGGIICSSSHGEAVIEALGHYFGPSLP